MNRSLIFSRVTADQMREALDQVTAAMTGFEARTRRDLDRYHGSL